MTDDSLDDHNDDHCFDDNKAEAALFDNVMEILQKAGMLRQSYCEKGYGNETNMSLK